MARNKNSSTNKRTEIKPKPKRKRKTSKRIPKYNRMEIVIYTVGIFGTVIFGLAAYFVSFHNNLKIPSIWLLFVSLVLYSLGFCLYLQDKHQKYEAEKTTTAKPSKPDSILSPVPVSNPKSFAVRIRTLMMSSENEMTSWWLVDTSARKAAPIPIVMNIDLTNLTSHELLIASFSVEMQTEDNNWLKLNRVYIGKESSNNEVVFGALLFETDEINFYTMIADKPIQPGKTVNGFLFFDVQPAHTVGVKNNAPFRFLLKDITGVEFIATVERPKNDPDGLLTSSLKVKDNVDIREFEKVEYKKWINRGN